MAQEFIQTRVEGLEQLQQVLVQQPPEKARRTLRDALELGGNVFLNAIQREVPRLTGFMASHFNIKYSWRGSSSTNPAGTAFVGPDGKMDYPLAGGGYKKRGRKDIGRVRVSSVVRWLEFGTSKMQANPFFTRAFESSKSDALNRVISAIKQGLGL